MVQILSKWSWCHFGKECKYQCKWTALGKAAAFISSLQQSSPEDSDIKTTLLEGTHRPSSAIPAKVALFSFGGRGATMHLREHLCFTLALCSPRQARNCAEVSQRVKVAYMQGAISTWQAAHSPAFWVLATHGGMVDSCSLDKKRGRPSCTCLCVRARMHTRLPGAKILRLSPDCALHRANKLQTVIRAPNDSRDQQVIAMPEPLLSCLNTIIDPCPPLFATSFRIHHDYSQTPKQEATKSLLEQQ